MITPEKITTLKHNEIFVFGSNTKGSHDGGAALYANIHFGAIYGIGEGLEGQSYAFPTLDCDMKQIPLNDWIPSIKDLIQTAINNSDKIFIVTKLGCGIAGFEEVDVSELFRAFTYPNNMILPKNWK